METKKTFKSFRYQSHLIWQGGRRATLASPGKPQLTVGSPPEFKGEPGLWTPEEMFVGSVNTCLLMTFVAIAQHKALQFVAYESSAEGLLENVEGKYRFTEVTVRAVVTLTSEADQERARSILESAEANCLITNSVTTKVMLEPEFRVGTV